MEILQVQSIVKHLIHVCFQYLRFSNFEFNDKNYPFIQQYNINAFT